MKILYLGSGDIGLPTLRALAARHEVAAVVTQPDQPAGRGLALRTSPIKALAAELNFAILQPVRLRRPEAVAELAAFQADIIVVFAYGQILPQTVLDLPRLACLNIHASLLPRWRGAAPIQAAILAGDAVSGHTIMFMDAGLDTGDILLQRSIPIAPDETGGSLHDRLAALAPDCILEALDLLAAGAGAACATGQFAHDPRAEIDPRTWAPRLVATGRGTGAGDSRFSALAGIVHDAALRADRRAGAGLEDFFR